MSYSRKLRKRRETGLYIGPTLSHSSPKNSRRGCLCVNANTYSVRCCKGYLANQGIGRINEVKEVVIDTGAFSSGFSSGFDIKI